MATTVLCAASVTVGLAPVAGAQSIDDKRAEAAALQDQIEATDLQISELDQELTVAQARRDAAALAVTEAEAKIELAKQEVKRIKRLVRKNAASLYRRSMSGNAIDDLDFADTEDLNRRTQYAEVAAKRNDGLLQELAAAEEDLNVRRGEAARARDEAAAESEAINAAKIDVEEARAQQQALLDKTKGELAAAIAAEQARREAAVRAQYSAGPVSYPDVGAPNGSAAQAIAFARGVKGAGYSKNPRMGPTYDCSGLTHMAWKAAGVVIPTVSNTQYAGLPHVPLNAIQPGDLIFWGPGGSSHVALYVGGGMIIDASSSKNAVTERPIWGNPSGAARVT
ncbi:MAG: NlpC/P60 family protein [Acidimicrobiia bacterium]